MVSQRQQELTAKIDLLLQEYLDCFGVDPRAHLGDWLCIISAPHLTDEDELTSGYSVTFSRNMLEHNAYGLLVKGQEIMETGEDQDGEHPTP